MAGNHAVFLLSSILRDDRKKRRSNHPSDPVGYAPSIIPQIFQLLHIPGEGKQAYRIVPLQLMQCLIRSVFDTSDQVSYAAAAIDYSPSGEDEDNSV